MWLVLDIESLEIVNIYKYKREAVLSCSEDGTSQRLWKGLYLASDENSLYAYSSYIVKASEIDNLIKQGFDYLLDIEF